MCNSVSFDISISIYASETFMTITLIKVAMIRKPLPRVTDFLSWRVSPYLLELRQ